MCVCVSVCVCMYSYDNLNKMTFDLGKMVRLDTIYVKEYKSSANAQMADRGRNAELN